MTGSNKTGGPQQGSGLCIDAAGVLHVGPRAITLPALISAEARAAMVEAYQAEAVIFPPADAGDEVWKAAIAVADELWLPMAAQMLQHSEADVEQISLGGVRTFIGRPHKPNEAFEGRVILYIHGGAWVMLADGRYAEALAAVTASNYGCTVYSINYRTPPDFPFPAALDDALSAYRALLEPHDPRNICVMGESAGGGIAAALALRVRDEGVPLPRMQVLLSPAVDLTEQGESYQTNLGLDAALKQPLTSTIRLYAGDYDLRHPYLSPIFGMFDAGYPPTFVQSGTRDLLLSGAVYFHRRLRCAGIHAELHVWEGMSHGPFRPDSDHVPEDCEISNEVQCFMYKYWH